MNGQPDGMENIRGELEVLKRLNKLDSFRRASFPRLGALGEQLSDRTLDQSEAVEFAVTSAIERLPAGPHQVAAFELIGFGPARWESLKQRRTRAANATAQATETFRRREESTVLDEVARQAVALAFELDDDDATASVPSAVPSIQRTGSRRPMWSIAALVAVAALVAMLAAILLRSSSQADEVSDGRPVASSAPLATASSSPGDSTATGARLSTTEVLTSVESTEAVTTADPVATASRIQNPAGPLDVTLWCTSRFGPDAAAEVVGNGATDWACRGGTVGDDSAVDFDAACTFAYGESARAQNLTNDHYDWECKPDAQTSTSDGACALGVGRFDEANTHDFARYASGFGAAWRSTEDAPCPATVMHRWSEGVIQELGRTQDGEFAGAILATAPDNVIVLVGPLWNAYAQVIGLSAGLVGFPSGPLDETAEDSSILPLSAGGTLAARRSTGQYHWIPGVAFTAWLEAGGVAGCLGAPVSNPYAITVGFRQDYENVALILDTTVGELRTDSDCALNLG